MYPLVVEITKILSLVILVSSFLSMIMIFFVDIVILRRLIIGILFMNITNVGFGDYLIYTLAPTLALNLIYFVVLFWPIRAIYRWALYDDQI